RRGRPVDVEVEPLERNGRHRGHAAASFFERSLGMASSANRVVFFTTYQFGMSPRVRLRFRRLLPDSSIQTAMASATFSGVPATIRLMATSSSQLADPCTSAAWIRLRNSGTVTEPGGLRA